MDQAGETGVHALYSEENNARQLVYGRYHGYIAMKLREFNFNSLKRPFTPTNLAVRMETTSGEFGPWYEGLTIGETLRKLPLIFADAEIKTTRWHFNTFVIELKGENTQ